MKVLAFDIGIKNLAWCCLEKKEESVQILGWDNYNLLTESSNLSEEKPKCLLCKAKGTYQDAKQKLYCVRHCPLPALRDAEGKVLKTIPKLCDCRVFLESKMTKVPTKKPQVLEELVKYYCLPYKSPKVSKAPDANLLTIHDSLRKLVETHKELWSSCQVICLENQPAFKNPTMKSVQMLLFATLRDCFLQNSGSCPEIKLVHAGKKVQVEAKGDEGYKDRKDAGEARALKFLKDPVWIQRFTSAAKKSDLADALCMCLDKVGL